MKTLINKPIFRYGALLVTGVLIGALLFGGFADRAHLGHDHGNGASHSHAAHSSGADGGVSGHVGHNHRSGADGGGHNHASGGGAGTSGHSHGTGGDHAEEETLWTCSMHPQIRSNEPGSCPLCGMDLTPAAAGGSGDAFTLVMTEEAVALSRIMTSPVVLEVPVRDIRMPGRVVIPDDRISSVTAASAGRLTSQRVATIGQTVRRGEVLGTLWSPELVTAQQELLDILRSDQSLLYENAAIGAPSGEGQRLDAGVNTGSDVIIATLNGSVGQLYSGNQRMDAGSLTADQHIDAGLHTEIDADASSNGSRMLQAARTKLEFLGMTPAQISSLEQTGEVVREVELLSPSAGIILQRNVKSQDYVSAGTVMYEIADISRVWMDFEAWEQDVSWLKTGDVVSYTSTAHAGQTFAGRVDWIDPVVNPSSRTVRVRMEVDNPSGNWKPDMLVRGEVFSEARNSAAVTTVPATAILWTGTRSLVYVQVPDEEVPTFESREVLLGDRFGDRWVVLDGLDAGERVVSNGVFTVDAEFQLRDKFSMMNREVVAAAGGALRRASRDEADADVAATGGERVAASEVRGGGASYRSMAGAAFRSGFAGVLDAYMEVKDALVASDAQASARAARVLRDRVAALDEASLRGEAQMAWLGQREAVRRQMMEWLRSEDIEHQRTQLYAVSRSLFETATTFGIDGVVYQQFCPMAFNDTGATWLAREQQIRNPYLPETMLGCGEVLQVLN